MSEQNIGKDPNLQPSPEELEFAVAIASLSTKLLHLFKVPVATALELKERYDRTFMRQGQGNETRLAINVGKRTTEIAAITDSFTQRNELGLPIPTSSQQYWLFVDNETLNAFSSPEHPPLRREAPHASFKHLELNNDGYSTETKLSVGSEQGKSARHTAPLKLFDVEVIENEEGPVRPFVLLDDVSKYKNLHLPDTIVGVPTPEGIRGHTELVNLLGNNIEEMVPAGVYFSGGGKKVAVD